jgi:hypothetical protein
MVETVTASPSPSVAALIAVVAGAETAGDVLLSSNRLVDLLLDVRAESTEAVTEAVDLALTACAHRQIVPVAEALDIVASITSRR